MNENTPAPEIDLRDRDSFTSWTQATIRYSDLDPNGHVNNGAINEFFEDGRVKFRNDSLVKLPGSFLTGFVLAKFSVQYYAPLFYPGTVDTGTTILRIGRTSYTLGQAIFVDGKCAASAEVITVLLDPETHKSTPLPDELREILHKFQPPAAAK